MWNDPTTAGEEIARLRILNDSLTGALYGDLVQIGRWRALLKDGKSDQAAEAMDVRTTRLRGFLGGCVPKGAMVAAEQPAAEPTPEPPAREPEPPPPALTRATGTEASKPPEPVPARPVPCPPQAERYPVPTRAIHKPEQFAAPLDARGVGVRKPDPTPAAPVEPDPAVFLERHPVPATAAATTGQESRRRLRQEW